MNIKNRPNIKIFLLLGLLLTPFSHVFSAEHCSDQYYINETLPNGARWDMCWEHRDREGIVLHHVFYTPKNGARQQILYQASIAQIHVPYDDNGARYHDISDFGIGGNFMKELKQAECKNGTLKQFSGKNVLCQKIENRHLAHHTSSDNLHGDALSLFSNSKIGAYHYLPTWRFFDDGTIEPAMGATGALQRHSTGHTDVGWPSNSNRTGIAHLHNYFWRLDFDLGASGTDDVVEELNFELRSGKRERTTSRFSTEKAREVNPSSYRSWRIVDGISTNNNLHSKSYEILLEETGYKDKGPSTEPFTHHDFFVTKSNECEKYASHNPTSNSCKANLAEFVNGENISGQDIIVWVGLSFYHMPRVEDGPHMDAHWNHFQVVPRDWHTVNPLGNGATGGNRAPSLTNPGDQVNLVGDVINYLVIASDADNDALNYTATGLPAGLVMNDVTERITGTITAEAIGANSVTVTATDGQLSDHASFNWQVSEPTNINTAPVIPNLSDQTSIAGDEINFHINATDPDGDTLVYSATGLVPGLTINSSTGIISGVISNNDGNYNVTVTVNDGTLSSESGFSWVVGVNPRDLSIVIDGNDADWSQVLKFQDAAGENTSPVDIETLQVTGDANKVYIAYHNRQPIDADKSWAWQVVIDSDYQSSTGLKYFDMGGDFLIVGNLLYKYAGDGDSWNWTSMGAVTAKINGKFAELSINRSDLGQSNKLKLTFYGANTYAGGETNDFLYVNATNVNGEGDGGVTPRDGITIDGNSNDWAPGDAILDEPETNMFPVDYQSVWFKQDSQKVYFAYKNRININLDKYWTWMILIDSDRQLNTGINFYGEVGADYMLLGGDLYKYAGNGSNWDWTFVRKVSNVVNGKFAELAVKKSDLDNSNNYKIIYYGSNTYAGGRKNDKVKVNP